MERYLMISDAAKEVRVESHVLRYWEEELHLPIRRNELGHRYYTEDDVELFKQIKSMKEGGLQLKAIKMILKDGKLNVVTPEESDIREGHDPENQRDGGYTQGEESSDQVTHGMAIQIVSSREIDSSVQDEREEKAKRLQWLLQQLIRETLQENNRELCREIKESVVKELDYQFRVQEEREEERNSLREKREEEHYQKLDELLRKKSRGIKAEKKRTRSEREAAEQKTTEQKLVEQKTMEQKTAEQQLVDRKLTEQKPMEQQAVTQDLTETQITEEKGATKEKQDEKDETKEIKTTQDMQAQDRLQQDKIVELRIAEEKPKGRKMSKGNKKKRKHFIF